MTDDKEKAIIQEEERWLQAFFKSLQEERRELDRFAWQIPIAVFGTVGVVLGVVVKKELLDDGHWIVALTCTALGVLTFGCMFLLQRLHERKGYRGDQVRNIKMLIERNRPRWKDIQVAPVGEEISAWAKRGNVPARTLGRFSSTGVAIGMLSLLFVLLCYGGLVQMCHTLTSFLVNAAVLVCGVLFIMLSGCFHDMSKQRVPRGDKHGKEEGEEEGDQEEGD